MLRAIPSPAWNSSKCFKPLSAPRRMRNAHFSPISSTAAGSGQVSAACLNESIPDVSVSPAIGRSLPLAPTQAQNSCKKQLSGETDYYIQFRVATFKGVNSDD